jgi:hypothetical protein
MKKTEKQPHAFSLCGAKTRCGLPCRSKPVTGKKRCRMHGGAKNSGAPLGNQNAYKNGLYTKEIKQMKSLIRDIRSSYNLTFLEMLMTLCK